MERQKKSDRWHITYHFVWSPMRAKACLCGDVARRLEELIRERAEEAQDFSPVTLVILPDRVYLAAEASPTLAPHSIICQVKAYTSRVLRDEFPELTRIPSLWTRAYLVMAVGAPAPQGGFRRLEGRLPQRQPPARAREPRPR